MAMTVLTGGARSGKSALAARLGEAWSGGVTFIATAEALDDEMRERIEQHRAARDAAWQTIEEPRDVDAALAQASEGDLVILDCLTLWVANLVGHGHGPGKIEELARSAASVAARRSSPTVIVTNEVGSGIVPADPATRAYRDTLGTVNKIFAAAAGRVLLVVAGRAVPLAKDEEVMRDVLGR